MRLNVLRLSFLSFCVSPFPHVLPPPIYVATILLFSYIPLVILKKIKKGFIVVLFELQFKVFNKYSEVNMLLITKIRILFIVMFLLSIKLSAQWKEYESGTDETLNFIVFVDSLNGWITGYNSTLLRTNDGGNNWSKIEISDSFKNFWKIQFVDDQTGYILANKNAFLKTTDGGENWNYIEINIGYDIWDFDFISANKGWIVGGEDWLQDQNIDTSFIASTNDGGLNWSLQYEDKGFNIHGITFYDSSFGVAFGSFHFDAYEGTNYFISENGGDDWEWRSKGIKQIYELAIIQPEIIHYGFEYSIDSCRSWIGEWDPTYWSRSITDLYLDANNTLYLLNGGSGDGGVVSYRKDYEIEWKEIITPDIFPKAIGSNKTGVIWCIGNEGEIFSYNTLITSVKNNNNKQFTLSLNQNYPNPFNSSTKISYSLPRAGRVRVSIFNLIGEQKDVLINQFQNAGIHNLHYNSKKISSGVYLVRLEFEKRVAYKKIIVLK